MKMTHPAFAMLLLALPAHAADLTFQSRTLVSENNQNFNITVFDGVAGYDNSGTLTTNPPLVSVPFGDGTVLDYNFFHSPDEDIVSYASSGAGRISDATTTADTINGAGENWSNVWTTTAPVDFTSTKDFNNGTVPNTFARCAEADGAIDISGMYSGQIYVPHGTFINQWAITLTMTGAGQPDIVASDAETVNGAGTNMGWITEFSFDNADGLYDTITYNYTNADRDGSRARFMGLILDGSTLVDSDGDLLDDFWEDIHFGDGDGTPTPAELALQDGTQDGYPAPDGDGLDNLGEQAAETDPNVADTDVDGINDGNEISGVENTAFDNEPTNPILDDSDGDLYLDGEETSGSENTWVGTTDNGVGPGDPTNPNAADTDGDGISDAIEIGGTNSFYTNPALADSDGDGVDDDVEIANNAAQGWDPTVDNSGDDFDGDGLTTSEELAVTPTASDPVLADTDGDGLLDGAEVNTHGTDPTLADTDGDLITDPDELANGSDPTDPDSIPTVPHLQVTFASSPTGPVEAFYQPFLALDKVNAADDPVSGVDRTETFTAFSTSVDLTVSYPDLKPVTSAEQAAAKRVLTRNDAEAALYLGTKSKLMRNWFGLDNRIAAVSNDPPAATTMRLVLENVPTGIYLLRTYHHDFENQHGSFGIVTTDANVSGLLLSDSFRMTQSGVGTTNDVADPGPGNGPELLRSTVEQVIVSDGSPITIDFQMYQLLPGDEAIFAINGLELHATTDSDGDRVQDSDDLNPGQDDSVLDNDGDGLNNLLELLLNLDPTSDDSDGDGRTDDVEFDNGLILPGVIDSTTISVDSGTGAVTLDWSPASTTDVDATNDLINWVSAATGVTPPVIIPTPAGLADTPVFYQVIAPDGGYGTSPWTADSDGDGASDGEEVNTYGSNPLVTDTDGNGFSDGYEVDAGSDPTDAADVPDRDADGYNNAREVAAGSDPDDPDSFPQLSADISLFVDFNSNQNGGGDSATDTDPALSVANWNQAGYQSYHANHEVIAEFATANYTAFGTSITVLPTWPDTTDARVQQSIGRGNDTWVGDQRSLLRDWIGVDTRTANGGFGDYDGVTGTATRMDLTIGGLPAGTYDWKSYHHDLENVWSDWAVEISTDGGTTFGPMTGKLPMTDGLAGGTPNSGDLRETGYDGTSASLNPDSLPSTYSTSFTADGTNDVVLRFTPYADTGVHRQIWGLNAFELVEQPR